MNEHTTTTVEEVDIRWQADQTARGIVSYEYFLLGRQTVGRSRDSRHALPGILQMERCSAVLAIGERRYGQSSQQDSAPTAGSFRRRFCRLADLILNVFRSRTRPVPPFRPGTSSLVPAVEISIGPLHSTVGHHRFKAGRSILLWTGRLVKRCAMTRASIDTKIFGDFVSKKSATLCFFRVEAGPHGPFDYDPRRGPV